MQPLHACGGQRRQTAVAIATNGRWHGCSGGHHFPLSHYFAWCNLIGCWIHLLIFSCLRLQLMQLFLPSALDVWERYAGIVGILPCFCVFRPFDNDGLSELAKRHTPLVFHCAIACPSSLFEKVSTPSGTNQPGADDTLGGQSL